MQRNWQDISEFVCGLWLCASPFIFDFATLKVASLTMVVLGVVILLFGELGYYLPKIIEEGATFVFGAALIASPWLLGFELAWIPTMNAVVLGVLLIVIATVARIRDELAARRTRAEKLGYGM